MKLTHSESAVCFIKHRKLCFNTQTRFRNLIKIVVALHFIYSEIQIDGKNK